MEKKAKKVEDEAENSDAFIAFVDFDYMRGFESGKTHRGHTFNKVK